MEFTDSRFGTENHPSSKIQAFCLQLLERAGKLTVEKKGKTAATANVIIIPHMLTTPQASQPGALQATLWPAKQNIKPKLGNLQLMQEILDVFNSTEICSLRKMFWRHTRKSPINCCRSQYWHQRLFMHCNITNVQEIVRYQRIRGRTK